MLPLVAAAVVVAVAGLCPATASGAAPRNIPGRRQVVEVAPLAFMRGRTLNGSFIILDEAQNTTVAQMKMFLTRMGSGSKIVVSGDVTQIDLPRKDLSGLRHALKILADVSVDPPAFEGTIIVMGFSGYLA